MIVQQVLSYIVNDEPVPIDVQVEMQQEGFIVDEALDEMYNAVERAYKEEANGTDESNSG